MLSHINKSFPARGQKRFTNMSQSQVGKIRKRTENTAVAFHPEVFRVSYLFIPEEGYDQEALLTYKIMLTISKDI